MTIQRVLLAATMAGATPALAQTAPDSFDLGQIETVTVTATHASAPMSAGVITNETMFTLHDISVVQALDTLPGVNSSDSGGPRNEQLIYVRGFNRFEVPLSIDGIRVYLPADNRLDFARFLTSDISEVQVAKGYASVLNGPGALGGEVNVVTRKPTGDFEVDARTGLTGGASGSLVSEDASLSVGTKQDNYYLIASTAWDEQQRAELSDSYTPTAIQPAGFRDHSASRDWVLHLKAGYTPNGTDEYSINYIDQTSEKQSPFAVDDPLTGKTGQKDWTWPYWDVSSLYFLSNTAIDSSSYVKTKIYYNTFTNGLFSYDNANFDTQTTPKAFRSYYDDWGIGGSVEFGTKITDNDTLKSSFFYRRDNHTQWETEYNPAFTEPKQVTVEDTYSLAAENTTHLTSQLDAIEGISYDWRRLLQAQDFNTSASPSPGVFVNYPLSNGSALNGQGALIYALDADASIYANISDRARFPTIFERYSTKFNTAASNPYLKAERAVNTEIGTRQNFSWGQLDGAAFYSSVGDAIESVYLPSPPAPSNTTQSQNVGNGSFYGFEASFTAPIADNADAGINYTFTQQHVHTPVSVGPFEMTGVPSDKAFAYLDYKVLPDLALTPNLDVASQRWTANTAGTAYYRTGAFALLGLSADWHAFGNFDVVAGVKNLLDQNYQLTAEFPEPGRSYFFELRYRNN